MLNIDNDAIPCIIQTMQVSFLKEKWEFEAYASALYRATKWGKKIDKQNKEYFSKNHLIDKYNV
jgi:hypothetical protein